MVMLYFPYNLSVKSDGRCSRSGKRPLLFLASIDTEPAFLPRDFATQRLVLLLALRLDTGRMAHHIRLKQALDKRALATGFTANALPDVLPSILTQRDTHCWHIFPLCR